MCPHSTEGFSRQTHANPNPNLNPRISPTEKHDGTDVWMMFCLFLWVWWTSLWSNHQGKLLPKNDFQASIFKQYVTLSRMLGKLCSFEEGKASIESVFSGLYLSGSVYILRCEISRLVQRTHLPESGQCFPANSEPCKHIPRSLRNAHDETGYGRVSVCAVCHSVLTKWTDIPLEMGQGPGVMNRLLLQKSRKVEQSYHCQK